MRRVAMAVVGLVGLVGVALAGSAAAQELSEVDRARYENLRQLATAVLMYAQDHRNQLPQSLEQAEKYVRDGFERRTTHPGTQERPGYLIVNPGERLTRVPRDGAVIAEMKGGRKDPAGWSVDMGLKVRDAAGRVISAPAAGGVIAAPAAAKGAEAGQEFSEVDRARYENLRLLSAAIILHAAHNKDRLPDSLEQVEKYVGNEVERRTRTTHPGTKARPGYLYVKPGDRLARLPRDTRVVFEMKGGVKDPEGWSVDLDQRVRDGKGQVIAAPAPPAAAKGAPGNGAPAGGVGRPTPATRPSPATTRPHLTDPRYVNLRELQQAFWLYAMDHKGELPAKLEDLREGVDLNFNKTTTHPVTGERPGYVYERPAGRLKDIEGKAVPLFFEARGGKKDPNGLAVDARGVIAPAREFEGGRAPGGAGR